MFSLSSIFSACNALQSSESVAVIPNHTQGQENATERDSMRLSLVSVIDDMGEIEAHDLFIENCDNSQMGDW